MSTKTYTPLAESIVEHVGGAGNIRSLHHCMTRLRFELREPSRADADALRAMDGVATTLATPSGIQVVVGLDVEPIYDAVTDVLGRSGAHPSDATVGTEKEDASEKRDGMVSRFIDFMASVFMPIIPAFAGAGMVRALLAILVAFDAISRESQTYIVLDFFAGAVFYFLPIILGVSTAMRLKANPFLAAVTAAIMLHPTWTGLVEAGHPVHVFGIIPLSLTTYSSSVVPILLIIWVQSHLERWFNKMIPASVRVIFVPLLTIIIMGTLALSLLGPIGDLIGDGISSGFQFIADKVAFAPPTLLGAFWAPMVTLGIHHSVGPLGIAQIASVGFDNLVGPGIMLANVSQGVAALVVAWRTNDAKLKQIASATGITAVMGVTEPVLYGVNVPKRYPLIAACIGGAAGGLYAGITHVRRFAAGVSGLPALPMYIGEDSLRQLWNIIIALVIAAIVTVIMTLLLGRRFERAGVPDPLDGTAALAVTEPETTATILPAGEEPAPLERTTLDVVAPVSGNVLELSEVPDAVFSSGAMGPGIAVAPSEGRIVSPVSGEIIVAMGSGHAYGIRTDDGVELLVHVGVDTVEMNGSAFRSAVAPGTRVAAGDLLVEADLDAIRAAGHPDTVVIIVTNAAQVGGTTTAVHSASATTVGTPLLTVSY